SRSTARKSPRSPIAGRSRSSRHDPGPPFRRFRRSRRGTMSKRPEEHLVLDNLVKNYDEVTAVSNMSLAVPEGELVALLGPSGCGKTTTLRMVAGFIQPTSGRICVDGVDITHRPPYKRGMGMVFQSYALFPHMDVFGNV